MIRKENMIDCTRKNPFDYTSPVETSAEYVGREIQLNRLKSLILNKQETPFISITGPRRMGTTSTLKLLLSLWSRRGINTVYIDLRTLNQPINRNFLIKNILSSLSINWDAESEKPWKKIDKIIPNFAFAIDELDIIQGPDAHDTLTHLVTLMHFLQLSNLENENERNPVRGVVLGSRQSLFDIERGIECIDSPWYNTFKSFRLQPLSKSGALALVSEPSMAAGCSLKSEASAVSHKFCPR